MYKHEQLHGRIKFDSVINCQIVYSAGTNGRTFEHPFIK